MKINNILESLTDGETAAFFYTPVIYPDAESILFVKPAEIITAYNSDDIIPEIKKAEEMINSGLKGFALINYETGYLLEKKLAKYFNRSQSPLLYFYLFDENNCKHFLSSSIRFVKDDFKKSFSIKNYALNTSLEEYTSAIERIKNYIAAGDTYQVNYTLKGKFDFEGEIHSLFLNLLFNQSARYTALINRGDDFIISFSPELFFDLRNKVITTKPMKGTARRGVTHGGDETQKFVLTHSEKEKAENLMIVDLLRNDIGRISKFGSVKVENLFDVEKYESLLQMVSTVSGELNDDVDLAGIIKNIFPCGSITGAPKIRTMEIIKELEKEGRGIYTGAIGLLDKVGTTFNVAIRTVVINKKTGKGEIGIGGGIVWDSDAQKEYDEALLKSRFLTSPAGYFKIFETMLVKKNQVIFINEHIERLKNAASFFLFKFDEEKIISEILINIESIDGRKDYRYRLSLTKWGELIHQVNEYKKFDSEVKVIISSVQVNSQSQYLYFKTTNRQLYESEYARYLLMGFFDVLFFNEKGELTEGAITNIFVKIGEEIFTPPSKCGLLTGIYRNYYIDTHSNIQRKIISLEDLYNADEIILTNSLRSEIKVDVLYFNEKEFKSFNLKKSKDKS